MCWCTYKSLNVKVAEEDIEVFKVVEICNSNGIKVIRPYFYGHTIKYGVLSKTGRAYIIDNGVHTSLQYLTFKAVMNSDGCSLVCCEAMHSYLKGTLLPYISKDGVDIIKKGDFESLSSYCTKDTIIMDCVIPKGTKYAVNEVGEVVSEVIKVTGFFGTL